jgi:hypothetical protein
MIVLPEWSEALAFPDWEMSAIVIAGTSAAQFRASNTGLFNLPDGCTRISDITTNKTNGAATSGFQSDGVPECMVSVLVYLVQGDGLQSALGMRHAQMLREELQIVA